jgi:hypothetical protein
VQGFKSIKTDYAILKSFELMRMFKKGQPNMWRYGQGLTGEIRLIEGNSASTALNQSDQGCGSSLFFFCNRALHAGKALS